MSKPVAVCVCIDVDSCVCARTCSRMPVHAYMNT